MKLGFPETPIRNEFSFPKISEKCSMKMNEPLQDQANTLLTL